MRYSFREAVTPITPECGVSVRLQDDARKTVVFFGLKTKDKTGKIATVFGGTGFWIEHDGWSYLVTARHVAEGLGGPFVIGHNDEKGMRAEHDEMAAANWFYHPDPNVDVAVTPLHLLDSAWAVFPSTHIAKIDNPNFGIGDLAYVVGLFKLFHGDKKITPIVHTGHIAMMPDEPLPLRNRNSGKTIEAVGYLIEAETLDGLSGAPVFIRYTNPTGMSSGMGRVMAYTEAIGLLGVWSGSWDLAPSETLAELTGRTTSKVPVGMGVAMPAERIIDILDGEELKMMREAFKQKAAEAKAASMDSAFPTKEAENPAHKEDFTRLLGAAAKSKQSTGGTSRRAKRGGSSGKKTR
jgi:Trypsin-like peptidase domain